jgi:hypothetical protein
MQKYLRCVKPICSPEAYEKTVKIVERFQSDDGEGKKLQEIIRKAAEEKDNWVNGILIYICDHLHFSYIFMHILLLYRLIFYQTD